MAITSWTSEGMVWTLPNLLEAPIEYKWIEAVRLACYERMRAIRGAAYVASTFPALAVPVAAGDIPLTGSAPYIHVASAIDVSLLAIYANCIKHTIGNPNGQRHCPVWTEADLLTAMGTGTYLYTTLPTTVPGFYSAWLWQCYQILNLCLWVKHPASNFTCNIFEFKQNTTPDFAATGWLDGTPYWLTPTMDAGAKRIINTLSPNPDYCYRYRSTGQWHTIDPTLTYDMQALMPVAGLAAGSAGNTFTYFDPQGSGYTHNVWNEVATANASTATSHTVTIGDDAATPPNAPPDGQSCGWGMPQTGYASNGDALGTTSLIVIRKYNVPGGFQFVP